MIHSQRVMGLIVSPAYELSSIYTAHTNFLYVCPRMELVNRAPPYHLNQRSRRIKTRRIYKAHYFLHFIFNFSNENLKSETDDNNPKNLLSYKNWLNKKNIVEYHRLNNFMIACHNHQSKYLRLTIFIEYETKSFVYFLCFSFLIFY